MSFFDLLLATTAELKLVTPIDVDERRDPVLWPFLSTSIWNTPIGDQADYKALTAGHRAVAGQGGWRSIQVERDTVVLDWNAPLMNITELADWTAYDKTKYSLAITTANAQGSGQVLDTLPIPRGWEHSNNNTNQPAAVAVAQSRYGAASGDHPSGKRQTDNDETLFDHASWVEGVYTEMQPFRVRGTSGARTATTNEPYVEGKYATDHPTESGTIPTIKTNSGIFYGNIFGVGHRGKQTGSNLSTIGGVLRYDDLLPGSAPVIGQGGVAAWAGDMRGGVQGGPRHRLKLMMPGSAYLWSDEATRNDGNGNGTDVHPSIASAPGYSGPAPGEYGYRSGTFGDKTAQRWPAYSQDNGADNNYGQWRGYTGAAASYPSGARQGALWAVPSDAYLAANAPTTSYAPGGVTSLLQLQQTYLTTVPGRMLAWTLQMFGAHQTEGNMSQPRVVLCGDCGPHVPPAFPETDYVDRFAAAWSAQGYHIKTYSNPNAFETDVFRIMELIHLVDDCYPATPGGAGTPLCDGPPPWDAALVPAAVRTLLDAAGRSSEYMA